MLYVYFLLRLQGSLMCKLSGIIYIFHCLCALLENMKFNYACLSLSHCQRGRLTGLLPLKSGVNKELLYRCYNLCKDFMTVFILFESYTDFQSWAKHFNTLTFSSRPWNTFFSSFWVYEHSIINSDENSWGMNFEYCNFIP